MHKKEKHRITFITTQGHFSEFLCVANKNAKNYGGNTRSIVYENLLKKSRQFCTNYIYIGLRNYIYIYIGLRNYLYIYRVKKGFEAKIVAKH